MSKYKVGDIVFKYTGNRLDIIRITEVFEKEGYVSTYNGDVINDQNEDAEYSYIHVLEPTLSTTIPELFQNIENDINRDWNEYQFYLNKVEA